MSKYANQITTVLATNLPTEGCEYFAAVSSYKGSVFIDVMCDENDPERYSIEDLEEIIKLLKESVKVAKQTPIVDGISTRLM
jgi:hypothetical protein